MFDRRPAAIARATSTSDVAHAIAFARGERTDARRPRRRPLGRRLLHHRGRPAARPRPDEGASSVDPDARIARVQPGVVWGELDRATQAHGLATTGGRMTTTGVAGFTLGSGSGWLERLHGSACDNLLAAELVTADGAVVTASETENPELLWGLRGGGGNFGVVTEFTFRLHPVGPEVYGGLLMYPRIRRRRCCGTCATSCRTRRARCAAERCA